MRKILEGFNFKNLSHTFSQDDFAAMAATLGIDSLNDEHRKVLQKQCNCFLPLVASWEQASRPSEVRKKLEVVHSDVELLMKTLHSLHDPDVPDKSARQSALALLHLAAPKNDWGDIDTDLMAFTQRLADLGKAAKDAISDLPEDLGGNPGDFPLKTLVSSLDPIFTLITEQQPTITYDDYSEKYTGEFVSFVTAFLMPLDVHYQKSNQGLGKTIQRVLRRLRTQ